MTKDLAAIEERYCFYRLAQLDFGQARAALRLARENRGTGMDSFLIRDAIVSYARPFNKCRGKLNTYHLGSKDVPAVHAALHKTLLSLRNQAFAHTDLKLYKPTLIRWSRGEKLLSPVLGFEVVSGRSLASEIPSIAALFEAASSRVQDLLRDIESSSLFKRSHVIGQDP